MKWFGRLLSTVTAAALAMGTVSIPVSASSGYNDMEYITSHVALPQSQNLTITRPAKNISTTASAYFLMGTAVPGVPITVNGKTVTAMGSRGSFGAYLALSPGTNVFTVTQGQQQATVTITRGSTTEVSTTNTITSMYPTYDVAVPGGVPVTISCVAPSGAAVTAYVNGTAVRMQQTAATAVAGVPAKFTAQITPAVVAQTVSRGKITYVMQYNGTQKQLQSGGEVYVAGNTLLVQVKNNAACVYDTAGFANYLTEARQGAVASVTAFGSNSYRLSFGGWIPRESVSILTGQTSGRNVVTAASLQSYKGGEALVLQGSSYPFYQASRSGNVLSIQLMDTQMSTGGISTAGSQLLSQVGVSQGTTSATIQFTLANPSLYWGYEISYAEGKTVIYLKYRPSVTGTGAQPLAGLTVALDAGHGGEDPGALGIAWTSGPDEADINLATAIAVQKRLESLGAKVILTRTGDTTMSMNDRMSLSYQNDADMFISLHANSVGYERDASTAKGTEIYYYYNASKTLAATLNAYISSYTGRVERGAKHSNYRVTIQSYCPAVLVELGFLCNPAEYDSMASKTGIFQTANAIGDALVRYFRA